MINISVQTLSQFAKRQVKAMKEGLPTRNTVESGKNYRFKVIAGEFEGRMERLRLPRLHARIERGEKKYFAKIQRRFFKIDYSDGGRKKKLSNFRR